MSDPFLLGWEEWLSLPDLSLPAIKAKVDTGARTSALHADTIEVIGTEPAQKVRFTVHPVPGREDVRIVCTADVIDRREVTSSNGERELRYVIRTTAVMGGRSWPIEVTLTNRGAMSYRMLLGRQAIQDDMFVDATASFRQPRLSYAVYPVSARPREEPQRLSIALMTRRPDNVSNRRIVRAAERRGHSVTIIDRTRLSLYISASEPAVYVDGRLLPPQDAIIVRAGGLLSTFSIAAVRQLEILGAFAINPAEALGRLGDPLALRQTLARDGIAVLDAAVSHADLLRAARTEGHVQAVGTLAGAGRLLRIAVIGGRSLAAMEEAASRDEDERTWTIAVGPSEILDPARRMAERAAQSIGLGFAVVDVVLSRQGANVLAASSNVPIAQLDRICGCALADALIIQVEQFLRVRPARG